MNKIIINTGSDKSKTGFTFMEALTVVILITIIAAFGIPAYNRVLQKGYERNAITGVISIHKANEIQLVKTGWYYPHTGGSDDRDEINAQMNLSIPLTTNLVYIYRRTGPQPGAYTADAQWNIGGGPSEFTIRATEAPLDLQGGTNPCCVNAGQCLTNIANC